MFRVDVFAVVMAAAVLGSAGQATAQTFVWQTQPYCNRLALTLTGTPAGFTVVGTDDGCGEARKASVTGTIVLNADGTAGLRVTIAPTDGARVVDLWATVSTANGSGSWADAAGHSGTLVLGGHTTGLPTRPSTPTLLDVAANPRGQDNPCIAEVRPATPTFCGYAGGFWQHGGLGLPGLQIWKDEDGRVHLRGSAQRSSGTAGIYVLDLPPGWRPKRTLGMAVSSSRVNQNLGATAMVLFIGDDYPNVLLRGLVVVNYQTDPLDGALHFGEVVFSVDR